MPIPRPVTKTKIATVTWGIPITDAVNKAVDTDIPALQAFDTSIKPTAWTAVTFTNGWTNLGGGYALCLYRKIGDMVYLRGIVTGGTAGSVIFTLPVGFRPVTIEQFATISNGLLAYVNVSPSGTVVAPTGVSASQSVSGISFSTI